jgi:hypothetical protein
VFPKMFGQNKHLQQAVEDTQSPAAHISFNQILAIAFWASCKPLSTA